MTWARLRDAGTRPVDVASLVALRVAFGLLAFVGATRFIANGWVERFFGTPTYFFRYSGFEWVPVPSETGAMVLFIVMAVAAVGVIVGWRYRLSLFVHLVAFSWVELIDVTNYLNHYYLYTLLGGILLCLPLGRSFSLDAKRDPASRLATVPAWMVWLVRFQIGLVYICAGLAKAGPDWLIHGQPLNLWLSSRLDFPVIGPLFEYHATAVIFSWAGFLHDLLIPFLLLWKRTRVLAFIALTCFHVTTSLLFNIGMFPYIMTIGATSFLDPDWPRRVIGHLSRGKRGQAVGGQHWAPPASPVVRRALVGGACLFCAAQILVPLRTHLHGGNVLWHEVGMRWSWRVMVREKNGAITYRVRSAESPRDKFVSPATFLTPHQAREFSGQPDMIVALGHHIADRWRADGHHDVEVRVDAVASLNGRPAARLLDPDVNIVANGATTLDPAWILPAPTTPPPVRQPIRLAPRVASPPPPRPGTHDVDAAP